MEKLMIERDVTKELLVSGLFVLLGLFTLVIPLVTNAAAEQAVVESVEGDWGNTDHAVRDQPATPVTDSGQSGKQSKPVQHRRVKPMYAGQSMADGETAEQPGAASVSDWRVTTGIRI